MSPLLADLLTNILWWLLSSGLAFGAGWYWRLYQVRAHLNERVDLLNKRGLHNEAATVINASVSLDHGPDYILPPPRGGDQ